MKRGKINLRKPNEKMDETNGLLSKWFGIHRYEKLFVVTHLPTGYRAGTFKKSWMARGYIKDMESDKSGMNWDTEDFEVLKQNKDKTLALLKKHEGSGWGF
jgi:hypothetical protein